MHKYLLMSSQTMQNALAYRVRFLLSIGSGLIQALVLYYIWRAVFLDRGVLGGFTFDEIVDYVFISFVVRNLYSFYTETGISATIRDGSVAFELIKPVDYQLARFFESIGNVVVEGLLIAATVIVVGVVIFGVGPPESVAAALLFCVSMLLSVAINFALSYFVGLFCFYTTSSYGIITAKTFIVGFFSGAVVPISFFPTWLSNFAFALPFHTIVRVPVLIYLGKIPAPEAVPSILLQLFWAAALVLGGRAFWSIAIRKVTIHGG